MNAYNKYIISTIGFGLCAIIGLISSIYSIINANYVLLGISLLFIYVSIDNFFCSSRAKTCGMASVNHYMMPPFLKK